MASRDPLIVVAYDVSADRVRERIARILEGDMTRVQRSLFEARMSVARAEGLREAVTDLLQPGDDLRVYVVPASGIAACSAVGRAPLVEAQAFYLL